MISETPISVNISIDRNQDNSVVVQFRELRYLQQALPELKKDFADLSFIAKEGQLQVVGTLTPAFLQSVRQNILDQTTTTLRNRINELGIAEPVVQQQGEQRILLIYLEFRIQHERSKF